MLDYENEGGSFVAEEIFVILTKDTDGAKIMITWRPTREAAEAFVNIYNLNRYMDLAEIEEVPFH